MHKGSPAPKNTSYEDKQLKKLIYTYVQSTVQPKTYSATKSRIHTGATLSRRGYLRAGMSSSIASGGCSSAASSCCSSSGSSQIKNVTWDSIHLNIIDRVDTRYKSSIPLREATC